MNAHNADVSSCPAHRTAGKTPLTLLSTLKQSTATTLFLCILSAGARTLVEPPFAFASGQAIKNSLPGNEAAHAGNLLAAKKTGQSILAAKKKLFLSQNRSGGAGVPVPTQAPPPALSILRKGTQLIDAGRLQDALAVFQQYVRERPADPAGYFWIGVCYDEMSNYPVAIQAYRDGITRAEQNAMDSTEMRTNLGNVYLKQNDIDQAIDSYKRALEINPQYVLAELNLGRAYIAKADYASALSAFDRCEELHCNARQVLYYRAKALMASGKKEQAAAVVQKLLQDFPNSEAKNSIQQEFQSCFTK